MKKIVFLSVLLAAPLLSSCKKNAEQNAVCADLVIYTPHSESKTKAVIREFRQRTNLRVQVVYGGTSELLLRLKTNENARADVFWGGGIESLEAENALFAPYDSPQKSALETDYGARWLPFSLMTMVIVYNGELVPQDRAPQRWQDLAKPYFKKRIFIPNPAKSGSAYSILNAILQTGYPAENWALLGAIKSQASDAGLAESAPSVHKAVASGEYFVGFTSEDAALSYREEHGESSLVIVYPADGTIIVPDGIALINGAEHRENAERFIDFALSKTVQTYIAQTWHRRSVRTDVAPSENLKRKSEMVLLPYDIFSSAARRDFVLAEWDSLD